MALYDPTFLIRAFFDTPFFGDLWWLWSFVVLFFLARSLWLAYVQEYYIRRNPYVLLEIRIPRELRKSPKAMEQVFSSIHALRNSASNLKETWWEGEVTLWFSCEVVSFGGEIHFYMQVPAKHRNIIESALYAQYADLDVSEAEGDYIHRLPVTEGQLEQEGYKLFGNELKLQEHDAYPIRTYVDFEAIEEERQLDPISALLEVLTKVKPQEHLWIQILIRPAGDVWRKAGEELVKELKEKGKTEIVGATGRITWVERSPGETDIMKAVERNIAKPGFETLIRYLYMSPAEMYNANFGQRGVYSAFNQYASEALNRFRHNTKVWTRVGFWYWPHLFPRLRGRARKERIYTNYRERRMYPEKSGPLATRFLDMRFFHWGIRGQEEGRMTLNTEELATIFHPPTAIILTGPLIKQVPSRKIGPPAGLPIYGEEGDELPGFKK